MTIDIIEEGKLSIEEILPLLIKFDILFIPRLSESININDYACKLHNHASFIFAKRDETTLGFIAFYRNTEAHQLYITLIAVDTICQHCSIGSRMLQQLVTHKDEGFTSIALEVRKNNVNAYNFYKKHGFVEHRIGEIKVLLLKEI